MQRDRAQQDDERRRAGKHARGDPTPTTPFELTVLPSSCAWGGGDGRAWLFVLVVVVVIVVRRCAPRADALQQHGGTDGHDQQAGNERQPGVETLRDDELESMSVTRPRAKTPAVCVTVTVAPRSTASRGLPFVPIR